MKECIEKEHLSRWDAATRKLKRARSGGYAQAVVRRMEERWPDVTWLLISDVNNKKQELFGGEEYSAAVLMWGHQDRQREPILWVELQVGVACIREVVLGAYLRVGGLF